VFHNLEKQIQAAFSSRLEVPVTLEQPRDPLFGEVAVPVAFQLARSLKQAPKKIAADLVAQVGEIPGVASMEVAGNGYINIRFERGAYAAALLAGGEPPGASKRARSSSNIPTSIPTKRPISVTCGTPSSATRLSA